MEEGLTEKQKQLILNNDSVARKVYARDDPFVQALARKDAPTLKRYFEDDGQLAVDSFIWPEQGSIWSPIQVVCMRFLGMQTTDEDLVECVRLLVSYGGAGANVDWKPITHFSAIEISDKSHAHMLHLLAEAGVDCNILLASECQKYFNDHIDCIRWLVLKKGAAIGPQIPLWLCDELTHTLQVRESALQFLTVMRCCPWIMPKDVAKMVARSILKL